jgi:hypothetical protein
MRRDILERRSSIEKWIAENRSKAFMCRELRCKPLTLDGYLKKFGISYAGNPGGKGKGSPHRKSASHYLHKGSIVKSHLLKLKLLEDKIKAPGCEECGRRMWQGKPIPLELHHINGDRFDNRLKNLQLLCPNCHALTDNNAGKGILSFLKSRRGGEIRQTRGS